LERLISAMMIIQIVFQFIPQIFAVFAIRKYRTEIKRPFGMWLYPVPALIALAGWIYVASTPEQRQYLGTAVILLLLGLGAYFLRARAVKSWPLGQAEERSTPTG
jgi:threonine/homoserine efflux transporter RhtA